jgi:spore coat polysaccharide biosynthesis protein SpsF (cytidylyltransferase family)
MKTFFIIQARLKSTRLPEKVLLEIAPGKTILECMLERVEKSRLTNKIIVATTTNPADEKLINFLKKINQDYFVGSENNVLDRYYQTAKAFGAKPDDIIVRLTSDCPLIDPEVVDKTIQFYIDGGFDYAANGLEPYTYPDGMDTEVFSFARLEQAWQEATKEAHREHVTFYFWKNPDKFKIGRLVNLKKEQGKYRLTIDYPEDYELLKAVYAGLHDRNHGFGMEEIVKFLEKNPNINSLNKKFSRNASWQNA